MILSFVTALDAGTGITGLAIGTALGQLIQHLTQRWATWQKKHHHPSQ